MKKNKCLLYGALLSCMGFVNPVSAQTANSSVNLGKSVDFLSKLTEQSARLHTGSTKKIILKVSDDLVYNVDLNVQKKEEDVNVLIGKVQNEENATFYLTGSGSSIHGSIILKNKKKAYEYYSENGNAYVKSTDINKLLCIDYNSQTSSRAVKSTQRVAATSAVSLQSLPGSPNVVYLDFDGQYVSGTYWNNGNPINAAPSGFDDNTMREIWELVSEDYRAFNVNITTDESVFNATPATRRMRCIFTPTNTAAPGSGGVAYIGSFGWSNENPCWVFNGGIIAAGEAASHEVGHTMGLNHDGRTTPSEGYYAGQGVWAPIMGVGYYKSLTQWSKGEYAYANNTEDDLAKIAGKLTYRTDDYGNTSATAFALTPDGNGYVTRSGFIHERNDVDVFSFQTSGGTINLSFQPNPKYPDLNIAVRLRNSSYGIIGTFDPAGLPATVNTTVGAGTYYLEVDGVGEGDPVTTGYSDYASIGNYSFSGTIPGNVQVNLRTPENPANTVAGLDYKFYTGSWSVLPNFTSLSPVKTGTVASFDITPRTVNDQFGFRFTGYVNIPADGEYTFYTASDDGSKLYIGTTTVVNNDGLHGVVEASGKIGLKAGKHAITVDFFEQGGGEALAVSYSGPGIAKQTIPASSLFRIGSTISLRDPENPANTVAGLDYRFYTGSWSVLPNFASLAPVKSGTVANFDITPRTVNDQFGFRFTGYVNIPADGEYTFYTASDDGSKLYIGTTTVVNNDGLHAVVEASGKIGLKAGKHAITVDFFEQGGGEALSVSYAGPGIAKQAIPSSALFRVGTVSNPTTCSGVATNGDFTYAIGISNGQPAVTFRPASGYGTTYSIIHYSVAGQPQQNYYVTPNVPFIINGTSSGQTVTFSFTYTLPGGGQRSSTDFGPTYSFVVGQCTAQAAQSEVLSVEDMITSGITGVFPNPATGKTTLVFSSDNSQLISVNLVDLYGRTVLSQTQNVSSGSNTIELMLDKVTKGIYLINVIHGNQKAVHKLIVE